MQSFLIVMHHQDLRIDRNISCSGLSSKESIKAPLKYSVI